MIQPFTKKVIHSTNIAYNTSVCNLGLTFLHTFISFWKSFLKPPIHLAQISTYFPITCRIVPWLDFKLLSPQFLLEEKRAEKYSKSNIYFRRCVPTCSLLRKTGGRQTASIETAVTAPNEAVGRFTSHIKLVNNFNTISLVTIRAYQHFRSSEAI